MHQAAVASTNTGLPLARSDASLFRREGLRIGSGAAGGCAARAHAAASVEKP